MKPDKQANYEIGVRDALNRSFAVFLKDVKSEFRTRYAINAIALFAITTLVAVNFAMGTVGVDRSVQAALLWIIIYFSAMTGLSRSFVHEEDSHTADALRLAAPPGTVFGGKLAFNFLLLVLLDLVLVPLFVGMMAMHVQSWPMFLAILAAGNLALSVSSTIVAAMVSKANAKGALFAVLSFPLLLPVLIAAIRGTQGVMGLSSNTMGMPELKLLVSYTGVMLVVSLLLFRFVWED